MPSFSIVTTQDEPSGLTVTTATGVLTVAALLQFINTEWASADRPILFDGREATGRAAVGQTTWQGWRTRREPLRRTRLHAKLAIVVGTDTDFGLVRMFLSLLQMQGITHARVFRSMTDAADWLL